MGMPRADYYELLKRQDRKPVREDIKVSNILIFTILGNLPRKSNSRQFFKNKRTGKLFNAKSDKALHYEKSFILQAINVSKDTFAVKQPLKITLHIYYQSHRSDLSDELFCDLLQKSSIIPNDRYITIKHLYHHIDRINPRVEVELESI
jgi:hypothetical protein